MIETTAMKLMARMKCVERQVISGATPGSLQHMADNQYFAELRFLGLEKQDHLPAMQIIQASLKQQFADAGNRPGFPRSIWAQ